MKNFFLRLFASALLASVSLAEDKAAVPTVLKIDYSADESLKPVAEKMQALFAIHFPNMVSLLQGSGQEVPKEITLTFRKDLKIPGQASGAKLEFGVQWFRDNPGDVGVLIHELTHTLQAYPKPDPWWITEGFADYVREKMKVDDPKIWSLPTLTRLNNYQQGYRVTAAFFIWMDAKFPDKKVMTALNEAMRKGTYTAKFWETTTGKSIDALWADCLTETEAAEKARQDAAAAEKK